MVRETPLPPPAKLQRRPPAPPNGSNHLKPLRAKVLSPPHASNKPREPAQCPGASSSSHEQNALSPDEEQKYMPSKPKARRNELGELQYALLVKKRMLEVDNWGPIAVVDSDEDEVPDVAESQCEMNGIEVPKVEVRLDGRLSHVLLHTSGQPRFKPAVTKNTTVRVFGLHRSGTRVLCKYIEQNFEVDVEFRQKDHGSVMFGGYACWKHSVPPFNIAVPDGMKKDGLLVICTIRDPCSWMHALSQHAYEIRPLAKRRRKQGSVDWMFDGVQLGVCKTWESLSNQEKFRSVPQLWMAYASGYLKMCQQEATPNCLIIKHEDLVERPRHVVQALAGIGLKRKPVAFKNIVEHIDGGDTSRIKIRPVVDVKVASKMRETFKPHKRLLEKFGYELLEEPSSARL